jgi:hypothetical protein
VRKALAKDSRVRFVVLGDFNEDPGKVLKHLENVMDPNVLIPVASVGSNVSHFPARGMVRALDSFFVTKEVRNSVHPSRVLRSYAISDHRPVLLQPRAEMLVAQSKVRWEVFDTKMIRLKGDMIANNNAWTALLTTAFGDRGNPDPTILPTDDTDHFVSVEADCFIMTFDSVCHKHRAKKVQESHSRPHFPRKLKALLRAV